MLKSYRKYDSDTDIQVSNKHKIAEKGFSIKISQL